jgi:hypothetical protein
MIRDTRAFVAVNAIGALSALYLLVLWIVRWPARSLFPAWFLAGCAALMFGSFLYNVIMKLRGGPVPVASWARGMTNRQLWLVKGTVLIVIAVVALAIIFVPHTR